MKKIIRREITNEDGEFYGVCGNLTRLGAYRVIKNDLKKYGIEKDVVFSPLDLFEVDFYQTTKCPSGEHEDWIWWGKPAEEDTVELLGKGWGLDPYNKPNSEPNSDKRSK